MNVFEKIIEKLENLPTQKGMWDYASKGIVHTFIERKDAISIVKEVAEEHNNGWIPISSRKRPKDNQFILFTVKLERGGNLATFYDTKYGFYEFYDECLGRFVISDGSVNTIPFGEVIAWQPLPEPYKE